ncbi:MAG: hypothetical protein HZB55_04900 [Deltaproteobacteria bacterium]|nr:hypothetical protein [Deltaproteobacteria bacterium]
MNCRHTVHALALLALVLAPALTAAGQRPGDDLFAVDFADERAGWASGRWGTVLHTADGGTTWEKQKTGVDYTLSSVSFVDATNGWAVGDEGTILHTSDGGRTWERQKSPVPYFLMGVQFVTKDKGWIVTERTHILHTEDGGKTWGVQFQDQDFILKALSFCDDQNGWAVGEYGYIYHTSDGGKTWVHQAGEFGFSEETGDVVGGSILFDVSAVNPKTAWAVGIEGYVVKTVDGGKTWQKQMTGVPKTHLFGVTAGGQGVLIAGDATLLRTVDGGATWQDVSVEPTIKYGWLYRVRSRGKEGYVAVGQAGWIYRADAQARTWQLAGK